MDTIKTCTVGLKVFLLKLTTSKDWLVKSTETRQGCKHKNTVLLQKNRGKERLEDYFNCCVFIPALFLYFIQANPYL